jgi:hypothetical protein
MWDKLFPNLTPRNHLPESPQTTRYNCLAHAVHNDTLNIWPDEDNSWPVGWDRAETVDCIAAFLRALEFQDCSDETFNPALEKVAIYALHGLPQHVARQKRDGRWTSKLGGLADMWHSTPGDLVNVHQITDSYGIVVKLMVRQWSGQAPILPKMHPPAPAIIIL